MTGPWRQLCALGLSLCAMTGLQSFSGPLHKRLTTQALTNLTAPARPGQVPYTLSAAQIRIVAASNLNQDRFQKNSEFHFDNAHNMAAIRNGGLAYVQLCHKKIAASKNATTQLQWLGRILHAVQDFYSHANYVELYAEYITRTAVLNQPQAKILPGSIPLLHSALSSPEHTIFRQSLRRLRTGTYSVVTGSPKNRGRFSHRHMNKDRTHRPWFAQAYALALADSRHHARLVLSLMAR